MSGPTGYDRDLFFSDGFMLFVSDNSDSATGLLKTAYSPSTEVIHSNSDHSEKAWLRRIGNSAPRKTFHRNGQVFFLGGHYVNYGTGIMHEDSCSFVMNIEM